MSSSSSEEKDVSALALFHFVTEQNVRAWCVWGGDIDPSTLDFPNAWEITHAPLRDVYIERATFLLSSGLHAYINQSFVSDGGGQREEARSQARPGYENLFAALYTSYYEGRDVAATMAEDAVSLPTFQDLLDDHLHLLNIHPHPQTQIEGSNRCMDPGVGSSSDASDKLKTLYEPAITKALAILDRLTDVFTTGDGNCGTEPETNWLAEIARVRAAASPGKTVIGVIGPPGAGKSSLINAVVDESVLLPGTTDVVTEVAYNHYSATQYRAEVEFVTPGEWEVEVRALLRDIGIGDQEAVAAAADKIRSVYPALSTDEIKRSTVEGLMACDGIADILGQTNVIENDDHTSFSTSMAAQISRPTTTAKVDIKGKAPMRNIDYDTATTYSPLVRVVRIYLKSPVLSTGATLVDLPGTGNLDSKNVARRAVAEDYMKRCDAHWIVSPVDHAIDDKVAQHLLNHNLRLQLHLDGAVNDLTFVCTKTDSSPDDEQLQGEEGQTEETDIHTRNAHAKQELKRDFAHGLGEFYTAIKHDELRMMIKAGARVPPGAGAAIETDLLRQHSAHFRQLGQHLPVFCVSARAYQMLRGEAGAIEETEIVQLQRHCVQLTEKTRWQAAVRFLLHVRQLLAAIALWGSAGHGGPQVSDDERIEIEARFREVLDAFEEDVGSTCSKFIRSVVQALMANVANKFNYAADLASSECLETVAKWGDLHVNTYRAICRRDGVFGLHNWNQELANLIIRPLVPGWKNVFEADIPGELDWFTRLMRGHLQTFHHRIATFVDVDGSAANLGELWTEQCNTMAWDVNGLVPQVRTLQRDVNRYFAVGIGEALDTAYRRCASETDPGMQEYIQHNAPHMYATSLERIRHQTLSLLQTLEQSLSHIVDTTVQRTARDYHVCTVTPLIRRFSIHQLQLKKDVACAARAGERELDLDVVLATQLDGEEVQGQNYPQVQVQGQGQGQGPIYRVQQRPVRGWRGHGHRLPQPQRRLLESIQEEDEEGAEDG